MCGSREPSPFPSSQPPAHQQQQQQQYHQLPQEQQQYTYHSHGFAHPHEPHYQDTASQQPATSQLLPQAPGAAAAAPSAPQNIKQEVMGWYRSAVIRLEAILGQLDAPQPGAAAAAGRELSASVDDMMSHLRKLEAGDR